MHASPEGHEWSGKGAQGYMIIMGVVMRPTLMIFGLVGSIVLVNIMILLMKTMFNMAAGIVNNEASIGPIAMIVMFCLYVWLSIKIVHRALDMINEVPSGIMKWIGGGHDPLTGNVASEGNSFVGGVMGKGVSAAQAGLMAAPGKKDAINAKAETAGVGEADAKQAAATKLKSEQTVPAGNVEKSEPKSEKTENF